DVIADVGQTDRADQQCVKVALLVDDRLTDLHRVIKGLHQIRRRITVGPEYRRRHCDVVAQRGKGRIEFCQERVEVAERLTDLFAPPAECLRYSTEGLVELRRVERPQHRRQLLEHRVDLHGDVLTVEYLTGMQGLRRRFRRCYQLDELGAEHRW